MSNATPPVVSDEKTLGMLAHLLALAGFAVPLGGIFGPLVLWLLKRDQYEYVDFHGKEALNFQISIAIYLLVASLLMFVLIGFLLFPAILIFNLVCIIIAAINARDGVRHRYPLCIRIL